MKTIKQTEAMLSKKVQDASVIYLKAIEAIMAGTADLKVEFIKNGTVVFDSQGIKLGFIYKAQWSASENNAYGMPMNFAFTYFIKQNKKDEQSTAYRPDQVFTKDQILKIFEDKIKKLRKLK